MDHFKPCITWFPEVIVLATSIEIIHTASLVHVAGLLGHHLHGVYPSDTNGILQEIRIC